MFFKFFIFVVWKIVYINLNKKLIWKSKTIIDIRDLNAISITNLYSLLLQEDIIIKLQDCFYIIVVDSSNQFYQFLIKKKYRDCFTIIFYKKKEQSNVAFINFKELVLYI